VERNRVSKHRSNDRCERSRNVGVGLNPVTL